MTNTRDRRAHVLALVIGALVLASCGNGDEEGAATSPSPAEETMATPPAQTTEASPAEPTTDAASPGGEPTEVTAKLTEFAIELSQQTFTAGTYEFVAEEEGEFPHALAIEGPGVQDASTEVIQPGGEDQRLTVTLQPGTYTLWCPVGNHRGQGMETTVTVE